MEAVSETLYCANHPDSETTLRCNKCGKPICSKCAVRTPVGYRCPECVRGQQTIFQTAEWYDYAVGGGIALLLGAIMTPFGGLLGWFAIFLGPLAGAVVAEVVRFVTRRRRGRYFAETIGGGMILGAAGVMLVPLALALLLGGFGGFGSLFRLLWQGVFVALAVGSAYARLRGMTFS